MKMYSKLNRLTCRNRNVTSLTVEFATNVPGCFVLIAEGCADLPAITGASIERKDNTATVRCGGTSEAWHLVCKDNAWIGDIKNCSKSSKSEGVYNVLYQPTNAYTGQ